MAKSFDDILNELVDIDKPLAAATIYRLSDLNSDDVKTLSTRWGAIDVDRRKTLIERLTEISETNFELDFSALARLAMTDLNDDVREAAIEATWADESVDMATRLIAMAS